MDVFRLALLGGVLGLDGTAVGQFMLSRPLVAGVLTGWVAGVPVLGATIGVILELYLLVSFPTGGARFPEGSTATVVAVSVAAPFAGPGAMAVGIAVGLVFGHVAGHSVTIQRILNGHLVRVVAAPGSRGGGLVGAHGLAIVSDFIRGSIVTALGILAGRWVAGVVDTSWPLQRVDSMGLLYVGAAVSVGILLHDLGGFRRRRILFAIGLAVGIFGTRLL